MGSTLASHCIKQVKIPKRLEIITESGKIFVMTPDRSFKVQSIKKYMEKRIGTKQKYLRLYIKGNPTPNTSDNSCEDEKYSPSQSSSSPTKVKSTIPASLQNTDSKLKDPSEEIFDEIELDDKEHLIFYSKFLIKSPRIYLVHDEYDVRKNLETKTMNQTTAPSTIPEINDQELVFQTSKSDDSPPEIRDACGGTIEFNSVTSRQNDTIRPIKPSVSKFYAPNSYDENNQSKHPLQKSRQNDYSLDQSSQFNQMNSHLHAIDSNCTDLEDLSFQVEGTPHF